MKPSIRLAALLAAAALAQAARPANRIVFDTPTSSATPPAWTLPSKGISNVDPEWEGQSLPIGNGSIGGNVFGSVARERVTLNEKSLWLGGPRADSLYWGMNKSADASTLAAAREALLAGDNHKADRIIRNNFNGLTPYNRDSFGCFATLGEFSVETGVDESRVERYRRVLDVDSAIAKISFTADGVRHLREFIASYPDSVMAFRFSSPSNKQKLKARFATPHNIKSSKSTATGGLFICGELDNNGMRWAARIEPLADPGTAITANPADGTIEIDGSEEVVFLIAADTDYRPNNNPDFADRMTYTGPDPAYNVNAISERALSKGFEAIKRSHTDDYRALFGRVSLDLGADPAKEGSPTPARLAAYRSGARDNGLEELLFNFGRYLLIASSRPGNLPANLQGMWHNNVDGPWHVDYHNNINLQMNYWPADVCALSECFTPFGEFVESLRKPGEITANSYFGTEGGWTASISANPFGFSAPLADKNMSWNYIPTAGAWLASQLWDHYLFTLDKDWLRDKAYPLIKSSADFSADILYKHNGRYTSAPSYSPEHGTADLGATYANAVSREILTAAIGASEALGVDASDRRRWAGVLDSMAPYRVGRHGQLLEWHDDIDDPADTHRHTNHLFGVHPGTSIIANENPELARAARTTLAQRGDKSTGWAMGWRVNLYARLLDGENAHKLLRNLLSEGVADNLWDLHPPFQIDGNFGATAGMAEMLLQSHGGSIELLPALPAAWPDGSAKGLRSRGGFVVDIKFADGDLVKAEVTSLSGRPCAVSYRGARVSFDTTPGATYLITPKAEGLTVSQTD